MQRIITCFEHATKINIYSFVPIKTLKNVKWKIYTDLACRICNLKKKSYSDHMNVYVCTCVCVCVCVCMYVCMYVCMHGTEMDLFKPYTDFSVTRQWKCFVYLKASFINFNEAIFLTAPCALFSRQRCRLPSKYMDMLAKSGINNGYNQRSVVWDSQTPFCRYTIWILVFPLSSTH